MSSSLKVELVSPEKIEYSAVAQIVTAPGVEGEFGVLKDHAPFITMLRPGIVSITAEEGTVSRFFVTGGFVEVTGTRCTVLADEAIESSLITRDMAENRLAEAQRHFTKVQDEASSRKAQQAVEAAEQMVLVVKG